MTNPDQLAALNAQIQAIPYCQWLGIHVDRIGEDYLECRLPFAEQLVGNRRLPAIHGGAIASFLETAAIFSANYFGQTPASTLAVPISVTLSYLRSAGPDDLIARAEIVKRGRRVMQMRSTAHQSNPDKPVTIMNASFLIPKESEKL